MTSHDTAIEAATRAWMDDRGIEAWKDSHRDSIAVAISSYLKEMGSEAKPIGYIRQSLVENLTNGADGAWNCQVSNVEFANFRIPLFLAPPEDIEKLKAERDEFPADERYIGRLLDEIRSLRARAESAEAERDAKAVLLEEARRVLEPFASASENLDDNHHDGSPIWETPAAMSIDASHLLAAKSFLARLEQNDADH